MLNRNINKIIVLLFLAIASIKGMSELTDEKWRKQRNSIAGPYFMTNASNKEVREAEEIADVIRDHLKYSLENIVHDWPQYPNGRMHCSGNPKIFKKIIEQGIFQYSFTHDTEGIEATLEESNPLNINIEEMKIRNWKLFKAYIEQRLHTFFMPINVSSTKGNLEIKARIDLIPKESYDTIKEVKHIMSFRLIE